MAKWMLPYGGVLALVLYDLSQVVHDEYSESDDDDDGNDDDAVKVLNLLITLQLQTLIYYIKHFQLSRISEQILIFTLKIFHYYPSASYTKPSSKFCLP
jgi:hypothetical protein